MSNNGQSRPGSLATIVEELKALLDEVAEREQAAKAELAEVVAEKRRIEQMVRAAGAQSAKPKKKDEPRQETLELAWQKIKAANFKGDEHNPGSFTTTDVAKAGVGDANRIVKALRDQGRIRLVGQRYNNPEGTGKPAATYVIDG